MQTAVFYIIVFGLVGGVLLRSFLFIAPEVLLLLLVIAFGLSVVWRRSFTNQLPISASQTIFHQVILCGAVGIAMMVIGVFRFDVAEKGLSTTMLDSSIQQQITISGEVVREPDVRATATFLTVQTTDTRVLIQTDRHAAVTYGDIIEVTGKLEQPRSFLTDLGREFDYPGYLHARGVTHTMSFVAPTVVVRSDRSFLMWLYEAKNFFLSRLALVIAEPAVGLGAGLLLGVQSALGDELEADFRSAGIIHIVVLSGYNIMLVVAFVMYVLAYVLPFRSRLLFGIGAVIVFALLVGYSPSVLRASVMAVLFLISSLLARPYLILRMLVLAGTFMVMWNPYILRYDIGFQLSFMATLGLILVAPHLELMFASVSSWFSMRSFLVATVATQIAVAPLLLYQIGEWSLVAIPVNMLVLPLVPVAMLLTFITGLVAMVSTTVAIPFGFMAEGTLLLIIKVAEIAALLPFAVVTIPPFPAYVVPLLYGLIGVVWYRYTRRTAETFNHVATSHSLVGEEWVIEEESSLRVSTQVVKKQKAAGTTVPAASSRSEEKDLPIFFR